MAFKKAILTKTDTNYPDSYWIINSFQTLNFREKTASFILEIYKDQAAYEKGSLPIDYKSYELKDDLFETYFGDINQSKLNVTMLSAAENYILGLPEYIDVVKV